MAEEQPQTFADPTKPAIKKIHTPLSRGWILFIGFNILFPFLFALVYIWMNRS